MKPSKKEKYRSTLTLDEAGNMIVSQPYNPDRRLSFGDLLVRELELLVSKQKITPVIYNRAVDLARKLERQMNNIYGGKPHGLEQAVHTIISLVRRKL